MAAELALELARVNPVLECFYAIDEYDRYVVEVLVAQIRVEVYVDFFESEFSVAP